MTEAIGFGAHKLELPPWASRAERIQRNRHMLARAINMQTTVAFAGAGCSAPLGYPTWQELAARVVEATLEVLEGGGHRDELGRFERFRQRLRGPRRSQSDDLLFVLGACQRTFERYGAEDVYHRLLQNLFQPKIPPPDAPNVYRELLGLWIRRFVTSNYDHEIERALAEKLARRLKRPVDELELSDPRPGDRRRSFTQSARYRKELAIFALGKVEDSENMVFHCHGSYREPDSLVVTEADYQRWYLAEQEDGSREFRQTIELLFGSNPILFVGFGLIDEDLLRPLRRFVAVDSERKASRPLFALMPETTEGQDWDRHEQLYDRYGVHVIPYPSPAGGDARERGRALLEAIAKLKQDWHDWRQGWLQKPVIRRVEVAARRPKPYRHYSLRPEGREVFGGERVRQRLERWQRMAEDGAKVIALVGPGGTGKSWHAMKLLQKLERDSEVFDGFFFWSSYYADDHLTGLDRALRYLDPDDETTGSRPERFLACLRQRRYFLIFDGIERLLREAENPDEGEAYAWATRKFLEVISDPDSRSTVLLTSRLWPEDLGTPEPREDFIRSEHLPRIRTDDIEHVEPFSWLPRSDVSALCSLLDGHSYGLRLAAQMLRRDGRSQVDTRLQSLRRALANTPPDARLSRVIGRAINTVEKTWDGRALKFLERVAVFMSPVTDETLEICHQLARKDLGVNRPPAADRERLLGDLLSMRLVYPVTTGPREGEAAAFTVHPTVRGYVFRQVHGAETEALPNFTLPGFTAGTSVVDPGSEKSLEVVTGLFDELCGRAEDAHYQSRAREARRLCRSAFGVVRSRMATVTAARWGTCDDYIRLVIRLGNLAKSTSPRLWDYVEKHDLAAIEEPEGPLFADELAWLYNEIGLTCYSEGTMLDTLAVWEQGYEINRVIDSIETGGPATVQSLLNLGAARIEYGRLTSAEEYLRAAKRANYQLHDDDLGSRITGYLALVQHLRGDLEKAGRLYEEALRGLAEVPNPRAVSVFFRHRADLLIKLGDVDIARRCAESSRAAAEAARYPDLIAYARCAQGHLWRSLGKTSAALHEYQTALEVARTKGIRKLEADVLSELSRLALDLGDARLAQRRAVAALRIANELTLGLRQTHGLVVLGLATARAGQRELGIAYLEHARSLADQQQYWLRGREAEEHLRRLGVAPQDPWTD